jgi:hypothetical protein
MSATLPLPCRMHSRRGKGQLSFQHFYEYDSGTQPLKFRLFTPILRINIAHDMHFGTDNCT